MMRWVGPNTSYYDSKQGTNDDVKSTIGHSYIKPRHTIQNERRKNMDESINILFLDYLPLNAVLNTYTKFPIRTMILLEFFIEFLALWQILVLMPHVL